MFVHSNCVLHLFVTEYVALAVLVREISGHTSRTYHIEKHFSPGIFCSGILLEGISQDLEVLEKFRRQFT